MALNYAQTPSVSLAYVYAKLNGVELIGKDRPQRLTGFNYFRIGNVGANRVTLALYDQWWPEVESILTSAGSSARITFQYGYTNGMQSPLIEAVVMGYVPTFRIGGVELQLEATSVAIDPTENFQKARVWPREGIDTPGEMRISDIVKAIAEERGWDADVDETAPVPDFDSSEDSGAVQKQFAQPNTRDTDFIINELIPKARRSWDGVGGYSLYFVDGDGDRRRPVLHFHPPRFENKESGRLYTFMYGDPNSEVISFAPQISGLANMGYGAGTVGVPFIDVQTGDFKIVVVNNASTQEKTLLGGPLTFASPNDGKIRYNLIDTSPVPNEDAALAAGHQRYYDMSLNVLNAEMVTTGDPLQQVGEIIRVNVVMPNGKLHYSSGLWYIMDITDSISGSFTSTYALIRNGYQPGEGITGEQGYGTVNE